MKLIMFSRAVFGAFAMFGLSTMAACNLDSNPSAPPEDEELGVATQDFDVACTTATLTGNNGASITIPGTSSKYAYSPNDQYNACGPRQFVVQINNPQNFNNSAFIAQPLPANSSECTSTGMFAELYGYNGTSWVNRGSDYVYFKWNGSSCIIDNTTHVSGYPTGSGMNLADSSVNVNNGSDTKVRISIQAWQWLSPAPGGSVSRVDYKDVFAGGYYLIH